MEVHDEYIPEETFGACLDAFPQVCIDLVLERDGQVLLARRTNDPAKGEWFWPGGRLYKGERFEAAVHRVAREELGIEVDIVERLGVYAHFWDTSRVEGADSRHTVPLAYRVRQRHPDASITLDDQHDDYRFVTGDEGEFHEYVELYLDDLDLDGSAPADG
jgi:colanic acid biosynthesis protein WcaH